MANILVGITGGIAAYKSAEVVSLLKKRGHEVRCVMTEAATKFITPLTMETLSQNPVYTELFPKEVDPDWAVPHIGLARWADCVLIVPATADFIGKAAHALADDFLSTCLLAVTAPVYFAPAMNDQMYGNPLVQQNIEILKGIGYHMIDPVVGNLACGTTGKGKMADPVAIADAIEPCFYRKDLEGTRIIVTAGPTREKIDPVRYLSNHSTGKMGYAIAKTAACRGAEVTLISGPSNLKTPAGVNRVSVTSAQDMFSEMQKRYEEADIIIKAAAVADYRPQIAEDRKIKKKEGDWNLILERNPDILQWLGSHKTKQILVGFAAETNDVEDNALSKLKRKNLDFIVANDLTDKDSGFAKDTNRVVIYGADGSRTELPVMHKEDVAEKILDCVQALYKIKMSQKQKNVLGS